AVHADAADRPRPQEGQDRRGGRAARDAALRGEGPGAGAAGAAGVPVGAHLGEQDHRKGAPEAGRARDHPDGAREGHQGEPGDLGASVEGVAVHRRAGEVPEAAVTPTLPAVRFEGISKSFPGVVALQDVSFEVEAGACHALCGENGAGKSTLGRILAGIHAPDAGRLLISGQELAFDSPRDARAKGIAIVHQELAFCENLSVAENLCLGSLPARGPFLSRSELLRRAEEKLSLIGAALDARVAVGALTPGQQQMVQIAAAVSDGARIIVFDEPTSSLSQHEAERLYGLIARLRAQGVTSVYVSHRMEEIFRLCDSVTVLRDGRHVATGKSKALDERRLVQLMIGRPLDEYFPAHVKAPPGEQLLRVSGLTSPGKFHDVSFSLRAGEVLGLAGLVGSGRSEVAQALFGMDASAT